jgi:hypothetical protein
VVLHEEREPVEERQKSRQEQQQRDKEIFLDI